ncbi:MAG: cyclic nucleotide-binding domain-containing protein [Acidimicrobiales bacterium]
MARASVDSTLAKIPLFKECTKKELQAVSRLVTPIHVKAGKVLTKEGDPGREFMIIASGAATVRRKGRKIAALGPGDFFGELALLAGVPRTATVIADTDMVIEALNRAEFATLLDESPSIARKVLSAVAKRSYDNEPKSLH